MSSDRHWAKICSSDNFDLFHPGVVGGGERFGMLINRTVYQATTWWNAGSFIQPRLTIRAVKVVIKLPAKYLPDLNWFIDRENMVSINSFYIPKKTATILIKLKAIGWSDLG
jgi:hypothetical protein